MFYLENDECAGILVDDGEFSGIWARSEKEVFTNADLIHEAMINLKKKNNYNSGSWVWIFTDNYKMIYGRKL